MLLIGGNEYNPALGGVLVPICLVNYSGHRGGIYQGERRGASHALRPEILSSGIPLRKVVVMRTGSPT